MSYSYYSQHSRPGVTGRDAFVAAIVQMDVPGNWLTVDRELVGDKLWRVVQTFAGHRYVVLDLLAFERGEWGRKTIRESSGPSYYDCPMRLLEQAGPPETEFSVEWRERVRAFHGWDAACVRQVSA